MVAHIYQMSDLKKDEVTQSNEQYSPSNLMEGSEWIIATLTDLANYCAFNQLNDVEVSLRRAIWESSLQLEKVKQECS